MKTKRVSTLNIECLKGNEFPDVNLLMRFLVAFLLKTSKTNKIKKIQIKMLIYLIMD